MGMLEGETGIKAMYIAQEGLLTRIKTWPMSDDRTVDAS